jgi:hypothetical protein
MRTDMARRGVDAAVAVLLAVVVLAGATAASAQGADWDGWWNVFVQQSFPKQTNTNEQIEQLNAMFGADLDTWDDVVNLSLGVQRFWKVGTHLRLGAELDLSQGQLDGEETVATEAGPARLKLVQRYSVFANALVAAHYLPCPDCRVVPFVLAAVGVAYEQDRTTVTLNNTFIYEQLLVDNDGWFPVCTAGVGLDLPFRRGGEWYAILGVAYYWGRLDHNVPASGSLAPAPEVRADTDSTGPNYWVGVGKRF